VLHCSSSVHKSGEVSSLAEHCPKGYSAPEACMFSSQIYSYKYTQLAPDASELQHESKALSLAWRLISSASVAVSTRSLAAFRLSKHQKVRVKKIQSGSSAYGSKFKGCFAIFPFEILPTFQFSDSLRCKPFF
jgi:hypothetical protein